MSEPTVFRNILLEASEGSGEEAGGWEVVLGRSPGSAKVLLWPGPTCGSPNRGTLCVLNVGFSAASGFTGPHQCT